MSLLCSVPHFTTYTRILSSIQLLVNKKFFHQSSFKLIKTFSSVQLLFTQLCSSKWGEVRGFKSGGKSPRLKNTITEKHTIFMKIPIFSNFCPQRQFKTLTFWKKAFKFFKAHIKRHLWVCKTYQDSNCYVFTTPYYFYLNSHNFLFSLLTNAIINNEL